MYNLIISSKYFELEKEVIKKNNIPICLFELKFNSKSEFNEELKKIYSEKNKINSELNGIILNSTSINSDFIPLLKNLKKDFNLILGKGGLNKLNRFYLEETNIDYLVDPHNSTNNKKIDFIHHFNSGLNQILCKFAKDKNIGIFISLNQDFFNNKNFRDFARINQNLRFARKYQLNININFIIEQYAHIKSVHEMRGIYSLFDIKPFQIKNIEKSIDINIDKKENIITKGIKIIQ